MKNMDIKPFLITALPHSGTKYTAMVFQAAGLDVRHEAIGGCGTVGGDYALRPRSDFVEHLGIPEDAVIIHQVRNPIRTIETLVMAGVISWLDFQPHLQQNNIDWNPLDEEPIIACMKLWIYFNEVAESLASMTYRVEAMEQRWPGILHHIGSPLMSFPRGIPTNTNQHMEKHKYTWETLQNADAELCQEVMALASRYGYNTGKPRGTQEAIIYIQLGIGDLVFIEPGIRLLLQTYKTVHLFCRPDAGAIYHNYAGVKVYPLDATQSLRALQKRNLPMIQLDLDSHIGNDIRTRVDAFTCTILSITDNYPDVYPAPELSVDPGHVGWAETFINRQEGQKVLLWQMESSRPYKNLPQDKSLRIINHFLEQGWRVLVLCNDLTSLPRHKNLKPLIGISIERFMGLCKLADVVLGMDSAPSWIAAALGTTVITLFGPTSPFRYAIRRDNVHVLQWNSGCDRKPCEGSCPENSCMKIPDEIIISAINNPESTLSIFEQYGLLKATPILSDKKGFIKHNEIALFRLDGLGGSLTLIDQAYKVYQATGERVILIVRGNAIAFSDIPYIKDVIEIGHVEWKSAIAEMIKWFSVVGEIRFGIGRWHQEKELFKPEYRAYQEVFDNFPIGCKILGQEGTHHILLTDKSLSLPCDKIEGEICNYKKPDFDIPDRYILVNSGVDSIFRGLWQTKMWPYWNELVKMIDMPIIQVGTIHDSLIKGVIDLRGCTTLPELFYLVKSANTIICCEGGIMHIAYFVKNNNIYVLRGPTRSCLFEYPEHHFIDSYLCEPCFWDTPDWFTNCPKKINAICMSSITPERVFYHLGVNNHENLATMC